MAETVRVEGLREYQAALAATDKDAKKAFRGALVAAAEPVKEAAVHLAASNIRNIGPVWQRMRVGVTNTVVYVAPKTRRKAGTRRPNLAGLLMDKALEPALAEGESAVMAVVEVATNKLGQSEGF